MASPAHMADDLVPDALCERVAPLPGAHHERLADPDIGMAYIRHHSPAAADPTIVQSMPAAVAASQRPVCSTLWPPLSTLTRRGRCGRSRQRWQCINIRSGRLPARPWSGLLTVRRALDNRAEPPLRGPFRTSESTASRARNCSSVCCRLAVTAYWRRTQIIAKVTPMMSAAPFT